jgi:hypothetical protein
MYLRVLALLACADAGDPRTTDPEGFPACDSDSPLLTDFRTEATRVGTALRARWRTVRALPSRVQVQASGRTWEIEADSDTSALLVGLSPAEDLRWRVVTEVDGGRSCGPWQDARAGLLDPALPEMSAQGTDPSGDYLLASVLTQTLTFVTILGPDGHPVWALPTTTPPAQGPFRIRMMPGTHDLLAGETALSADADGRIHRIALDGSERGVTPLRGGHTDFDVAPDGTITMLGWDIRDVGDGRRLLGDTLRTVSPEGTQDTVWSTFDAIAPDLSQDWHSPFYVADPTVEDWSHANAVRWSEDEQAWYVAMRGVHSIARVNRDGATAWTMGGPGSRIPLPELSNPHAVEPMPDGSLLVFNGEKATCSRALRLTLDPARDSAAIAQAFTGEACLEVVFLGDTRVQSDGSVRVAWSSAGRLETFLADGSSVQRVDLPAGAIFGYVQPVRPAELGILLGD